MDAPYVRKSGSVKKIFYAGFLSPFKHVGYHPQFDHIRNPPHGYEFVTSGRVGMNASIKVLRSLAKLSLNAMENGSRPMDVGRFIRSRSILAQLSVPSDISLVFMPSMPYTLGQVPWVIEIEDTTTLFAPFARIAGKRVDPRLLGIDGIYDPGFYLSIKALLESDNCRGVICHVRSTAESIPVLFNNPKLGAKVFHVPLGIEKRPAHKPLREEREVTLLFTNSWHQGSTGFYLRGGLDVLEAYARLRSNHRYLRLILRSQLPESLDRRYRQIIEQGAVKVVGHFLSTEDMEDLFSRADIYVLPSARLHVVSILQAMAHGLAVVVSDGWGIDECVDDGRNGLVVPGRYGKCSWMDGSGMLRENYKPLLSADPAVVDRLVERLFEVITNTNRRRELGEAARKDVDGKFSLENWNVGLGKAFDLALTC
jgi:glycosyltransferase involved in cell wall biosynthesis